MVSMNSSAVPDRRVSRALWQGSGCVGQAQVDSGAPRPGHRPRACFNLPLLGVLAETQVLCIRYPLRRRGDCIDEDMRRRGKKPQDWRRPLWVSQGGSSSRFESTPCHRGLRWHGRWPGTASARREADMRHLQNAAAPGVRRQGTGVTECSADGPCTNDEAPEACNDRRKRQDGGCLGVIQALGLSDKVQRNSPASNAAASDNEWGKQKCPIPAAQGYEPVLWSGVCAMSFGMRRVSLGSETQGDIQERSSTHFDREPTPSSLPKGSH